MLKTRYIIDFFVLLILFGYFFVSNGIPYDWGFKAFLNPLRDFYYVNRIQGFDIIIFAFSVTLLLIGANKFINPKKRKIIIFIQISFLIFALFNPVNSIYTQFNFAFFLNQTVRTLIISSILIIVLSYLNNTMLELISSRFLKIGIIMIKIKIIFDLTILLLGQAPVIQGNFHVSTVGGLGVFWLGLMHLIFVAAFLFQYKIKYLIWVILTMLCIILSYKRTIFYVVLISDLISYIMITVYKKEFFNTRIFISFLVVVFGIIFISSSKIGDTIKNRMGAAIEFTGLVSIDEEGSPYSDSGHLLQSQLTTEYMLDNMSFWGGGINRRDEDYLWLEGQSVGGVHNNIASVWQYFGIPGLIYYLLIFIFFLRIFLKRLNRNTVHDFNKLFIFSLSLFMIVRMIAGWFSGDFFFNHVTHYFIYIFVLIFILVKPSQKNIYQNYI